jgi:uncharacterized protein YacL (UPF0231 family)
MDFEFIYDYKTKNHSIVTGAEQKAIGVFLSQELEGDITKLEELLASLTLRETKIEYTEWSIEVEVEDIFVFHHSILASASELDNSEHPSYLDWEVSAKCGKDDFIELVSNWISFIDGE